MDNETVPSTLWTSLKPFVNTGRLTLTFAAGTNSEWKFINRDPHTDKIFNSLNSAHTMITHQILMCIESQGSISTRLEHLRKNTLQQEQIIRLTGHINVELGNDKKNLLTDLLELWQYKEILSIETKPNSRGDRVMDTLPMTYHKFWYICHALNVVCVQQQPYTQLSVTPNTMPTGTNRKAQQSCGSGTNRE